MTKSRDEYLGDGVYASFDDYHVWLDCRAQPELGIGPSGTPAIALDPAVLSRLDEYRKRLAKEIANAG